MSWSMFIILTGSSGMSGAVHVIIGLKSFLELLTQYSILFAFALPNHKDLQRLDVHLMESLRQK